MSNPMNHIWRAARSGLEGVYAAGTDERIARSQEDAYAVGMVRAICTELLERIEAELPEDVNAVLHSKEVAEYVQAKMAKLKAGKRPVALGGNMSKAPMRAQAQVTATNPALQQATTPQITNQEASKTIETLIALTTQATNAANQAIHAANTAQAVLQKVSGAIGATVVKS